MYGPCQPKARSKFMECYRWIAFCPCPIITKEDCAHVFFSSARIWNYIQISWAIGHDMLDIAMRARHSTNQPFFFEVVFLAWWNIWIVGNEKISKNGRPSFSKWEGGCIHDISLPIHRIKDKYTEKLVKWISFLPS